MMYMVSGVLYAVLLLFLCVSICAMFAFFFAGDFICARGIIVAYEIETINFSRISNDYNEK